MARDPVEEDPHAPARPEPRPDPEVPDVDLVVVADLAFIVLLESGPA